MIAYIRQRIWLILVYSGVARMFSDALYFFVLYYLWTGRVLHLNPPVNFNEKLQWLKLHYRNPLMVVGADKYGVRELVEKRIGSKYLNECLGVYTRVEDIDYEKLPERFVLKATHGSSWNIVCKDKSKLDWACACKKMKKWLATDFSKFGREWQYHDIQPRIVCEKFLVDRELDELRDFKMFTFRGETKYIWVDFDKGGNGYRNVYDRNWNFQREKGSLRPHGDGTEIPRPECLDELLDLAKKLAYDFPQCRVDFYVLEGKTPVFGELTFTSANGCNAFYPYSFNVELGSYIDLGAINEHLI